MVVCRVEHISNARGALCYSSFTIERTFSYRPLEGSVGGTFGVLTPANVLKIHFGSLYVLKNQYN